MGHVTEAAMMNDDTMPTESPDPEEWEDDGFDPVGPDDDVPGPPQPVNWNLLLAHDLEQEWLALNRWVEWVRREYALPASVIPPCWHRHPALKWELSALHLHWFAAYDPEQDASAAIGWYRDFAAARQRLRDWSPPPAPVWIVTAPTGRLSGLASPRHHRSRTSPSRTGGRTSWAS
ncbi:hypothetical protein KVA01_08560 [Kocuria varians]|uniref:DUF4913 domain-containing protein n=1 Tax=Kocuria varians TaxID=1272 RepID=A0A4Y4D0P2_KOCVA|nr:hypothetical protein KVA01_08560 [Kocuria varians]